MALCFVRGLFYSSGCFRFVGSWGPAVLFVSPVFVLVLGFREEGVGPKGWALLLIDLLLGGGVVFLWREVGGSLFGLMEGYGSLCTVRGSFLGSRVVFGFSYFIPVFVFVLLGPRAQLSSLVFLPTPALPFAQVSEEGGLGWIGVGDWRKVPLLERLGGKGVFVWGGVVLWREVASLGWWGGMALFVLLGAFLGSRVVFGFSYCWIFQCLFLFCLGPRAQLSS